MRPRATKRWGGSLAGLFLFAATLAPLPGLGDPLGATALTLSGPTTFVPGAPQRYTGAYRLSAGGGGIPSQPVDILVDGNLAAQTQTASDGTFSADVVLTVPPSRHELQAVVYRGTALETRSTVLETRAPTFALSVSVAGNGVVTSSPSGISCPGTCVASFSPGTNVTLTPAAGAGSAFSGWSGACSGTGACSAVMDADRSVAASFVVLSFQLTVDRTGPGTVSSSPAGISCGVTCSAQFAAGTVVTLSASPEAGATFVGWTGGCAGATPTCQVTLNADTTVGASFDDPNVYTLTVQIMGSAAADGRVFSASPGIDCPTDCTETYPSGTLVSLYQGNSGTGVVFTGWGGACSGQSACDVVMNSDKTVTATFTKHHMLYVYRSGTGASYGYVSSSPAGIACGGDCNESYPAGTGVQLTASASYGASFTHWGGHCAGQGNPCTVTVNETTIAEAFFTY